MAYNYFAVFYNFLYKLLEMIRVMQFNSTCCQIESNSAWQRI